MEVETSRINSNDRVFLEEWMRSHAKHFMPSKGSGSYANRRHELHLKHFVSIREKTVTAIADYRGGKYIKQFADLNIVYEILERYHPGFDTALCLRYEQDGLIKWHRDHGFYDKPATCLNLSGRARYQLKTYSKGVEQLQEIAISPGIAVRFDNKQPHKVENLSEHDRLTIMLFNLKRQHIPDPRFQQLTLF